MNSINRLILRHVVSGKVKLTTRLIKDLKKIEQDHPVVAPPNALASESSPPPDQFNRANAAINNKLTFISPLPGRWIRRTECAAGIALLLAASLVRAACSSATFETENNDFARGKYGAAVPGLGIHHHAEWPL